VRKKLQSREGQRKKFQAVFVRFGKKVNFRGLSEETILLKNIVDLEDNKLVSDHAWFNYTKAFQKVKLEPETRVEFEARVKQYSKGYVNRRYKIDHATTDYRLSHPSKISVRS
jgi:hypothetical protein